MGQFSERFIVRIIYLDLKPCFSVDVPFQQSPTPMFHDDTPTWSGDRSAVMIRTSS